jgi:hypothetical protein
VSTPRTRALACTPPMLRVWDTPPLFFGCGRSESWGLETDEGRIRGRCRDSLYVTVAQGSAAAVALRWLDGVNVGVVCLCSNRQGTVVVGLLMSRCLVGLLVFERVRV